jgi:hypothetical protein
MGRLRIGGLFRDAGRRRVGARKGCQSGNRRWCGGPCIWSTEAGHLRRSPVSFWSFLLPLAALMLLFAGGRSFLAVRGLALPRETELLCSFEFRLILALWVSFDRRTRDLIVPFEFDALVFFAWPFVLPWYLHRARVSVLSAAIPGVAFYSSSPWPPGPLLLHLNVAVIA